MNQVPFTLPYHPASFSRGSAAPKRVLCHPPRRFGPCADCPLCSPRGQLGEDLALGCFSGIRHAAAVRRNAADDETSRSLSASSTSCHSSTWHPSTSQHCVCFRKTLQLIRDFRQGCVVQSGMWMKDQDELGTLRVAESHRPWSATEQPQVPPSVSLLPWAVPRTSSENEEPHAWLLASFCDPLICICLPGSSFTVSQPSAPTRTTAPGEHLQRPVDCDDERDVVRRQPDRSQHDDHGNEAGLGDPGRPDARCCCCYAAKKTKRVCTPK